MIFFEGRRLFYTAARIAMALQAIRNAFFFFCVAPDAHSQSISKRQSDVFPKEKFVG